MSTENPATYCCSACGKTFTSDWTEEDAITEGKENFPGYPVSHYVTVCDDCYHLAARMVPFAAWVARHPYQPPSGGDDQ